MELGKNPREEWRSKIVKHGAIWKTFFHLYVFMLRLDLCDYNGLDIITACFIALPALVASCAPRIELALALPQHSTGGCDYGTG